VLPLVVLQCCFAIIARPAAAPPAVSARAALAQSLLRRRL